MKAIRVFEKENLGLYEDNFFLIIPRKYEKNDQYIFDLAYLIGTVLDHQVYNTAIVVDVAKKHKNKSYYCDMFDNCTNMSDFQLLKEIVLNDNEYTVIDTFEI